MTRTPTTETFRDQRGDERYLRATCHADAGTVVLSLWRDESCAGTFRLDAQDVPDLIALLRGGLKDAYDEVRSTPAGLDVLAQRGPHPSENLTSTFLAG